jgi:hemerythrin
MTKLIIWDQAEFTTRIELIDQQHKRLVEMINVLHDAMLNRKSATIFRDVLDQAIDYTVYHFGTEESLMEQYQYPDRAEHTLEHNEFKMKVLNYRANLDTPSLLALEFSQFLRSWLLEHTMTSDRDLGRFLSRHNFS